MPDLLVYSRRQQRTIKRDNFYLVGIFNLLKGFADMPLLSAWFLVARTFTCFRPVRVSGRWLTAILAVLVETVGQQGYYQNQHLKQ